MRLSVLDTGNFWKKGVLRELFFDKKEATFRKKSRNLHNFRKKSENILPRHLGKPNFRLFFKIRGLTQEKRHFFLEKKQKKWKKRKKSVVFLSQI